MIQLNPYLTFNGNCSEAMDFYRDCLGGDLTLDRVGDSPMAEKMPDMKDKVMHSMLKSGGMIVMASDMVMGGELKEGSRVTLTISGGTPEEIKALFSKLSQGGKIGQPLQEAFFGLYGDLTDQYGILWAFQAELSKQ